MQPGSWFRMPKALLEVLRPGEAVVLAFLINHRSFADKQGKWFVCSMRTLTDNLCINKRQQENVLSSLESLEFVRVTRDGVWGKRLIRLNDKKLAHLLETVPSQKEDREADEDPGPKKRTRLATKRGPGPVPKRGPGPLRARDETNRESNTKTVEPCGSTKGGFLKNGGANFQSFEQKMCDRLELHIRQTRKLFRIPNKKAWLHEMRELMKDLGGDQERLKRVLKWLIQTKPGKMVPEVHSAKQFREKFTRLEACMERDPSKGRVKISGPVFDWEQKAYETLKDAGWAGASAQTLRFCVHASAENYEAHSARVVAMVLRLGPKHIVSRFVKATFDSLHSPTDRFCIRWWRGVAAQLAKWRDFNGTLQQFVFSPEHRDFQKMGQQAARNYAGASSTLWQDYLKELNEN